MPLRHQPSRFGEQQKQDAVDDDERFLEERAGRCGTTARPRAREGADETDQRFVNAELQRRADVGAVLLGYRDRTVEQRVPAGGKASARSRPQNTPNPTGSSQRGLEIELRETGGSRCAGRRAPGARVR